MKYIIICGLIAMAALAARAGNQAALQKAGPAPVEFKPSSPSVCDPKPTEPPIADGHG